MKPRQRQSTELHRKGHLPLLAALPILSLFIVACSMLPGKPTVTVLSPLQGSQFREGQEVLVQSTASDMLAVNQVDLLVDGILVSSERPPSAPANSFMVIQRWQAVPGTHILSVRALNSRGTVSDPINLSVTILATPPSTATPTSTATSTATATPSVTPSATATLQKGTGSDTGTGQPLCTSGASFVADVTVPPGTAWAPGQAFSKIWRMRNDGACTWDSSYQFMFLTGEAMTTLTAFPWTQSTPPGAMADMIVPMVAPSAVGLHTGRWQMRGPQGLFGPSFEITINVINVAGTSGCGGPPVINGFEAVPSTISPGESTQLVWGKVDNAARAEIDHGIGGIGTPGSLSVSPAQSTIYVLTATGCGGTATKQVTVNVRGTSPIANPTDFGFTFIPKSGRPGSDVQLILNAPIPGLVVYYNGFPLVQNASPDGKLIIVKLPSNATTGYFYLQAEGKGVQATEPYVILP